MNVYPKQKLSSKEKNKIDKVSGKNQRQQSIDYFIESSLHTNHQDEILSLARLTEDIVDEKDYNHVLNPFNTTVEKYKRYGSKLRNFNIISPVLNLYAGEFNGRFKNIQVLESNSEDDNKYKQSLNNTLKQYYAQDSLNKLNELGIQTGKESVEQPTVEEVIDSHNRDYDANRIITGQEILEYIRYDQDLDDKYQDAYMDWLRFGMVVSYKGIFHDDLDFETVPAWEITVPLNTKSNFVEDSDWAVRRQVWKANQIVDRFHDKLSSDDISWLESEAQDEAGIGSASGYVNLPTKFINSKEDYNKFSMMQEVSGIEVFHVQYRSFEKVGILKYLDEMGQIQEMEVDDTYKLDKSNGDISIEWGWQSVVSEGWRIGNSSSAKQIYIDVRDLPYNRMELNNSSAQKLSYNGRLNVSSTGELQSISKSGKNYQILYNILHYQFEKIINKNKDKIMVIPQGLIPKGKGGWDEEKFMYYANANSLAVIDETSPTAALALQGIKVLDMSLGNFARDMIDLMQSVKAEWWEAIGMNRQRYGDSKASDGKAVTEQAIFRSAVISDELNRKFEKFQEKDYAGLLDISKLAFIGGKKSKYINSEGREAFINLNIDDALFHLESDYDIHVKNSREESDNINTAKEYGFSLGQNGQTPEMLELISSRNFTRTKEIVNKLHAINQQREADAQQNALASNEKVAELNNATQQAKNEVEKYKADKEYEKAIDVKNMELGNNVSTSEIKDDSENVRMNDHKIRTDNEKLGLDRQKHNLNVKETNAKITQMKKKPNN